LLLRTITIFSAILLVSSFASISYTDQTALNVNQSRPDNPKVNGNGNNNQPDRLNLSENVAVIVHHKYVNPHDNTITEKIVVYTSLNQNSMSLLKQNSDTKTTMDRIWNLDRIRFNGRAIVSENTLWNQEAATEKLVSFIKTGLSSGSKVDVTNDPRFAVQFVDANGNGMADQMKRIVPKLSEQEFSIKGIIHISNAQQLDSNRNFVKDVYPEIQARDGNWTGNIPVDNYIQITFGKNLTKNNDVTIFAKSNYSNASIEVYEKNSNHLVAHFGSITQDGRYRVLLTNLNGPQDTFDLKIVGNPADLDYIVDPAFTPSTSDTIAISNKVSTGKPVKDAIAISESVKLPQKKVTDTLSLSEKASTSHPVKDVAAISESVKLPQKKVTDTLSLSEKASTSHPVKDVVAISESVSVNTAVFHPVSVTDTLSLSEKVSRSHPVKDVVAISESSSVNTGVFHPISVTDTLSLSEKAIGAKGTFASLSESVTLTDIVATVAVKSVSLSESLATSDAVSTVAVKFVSLSESITTSDAVSRAAVKSVSLLESLATSDAVSRAAVKSVSLLESLTTSDAVSAGAVKSASLSESITTSDAASTSRFNAGYLVLSENVITDDVNGVNLAPNQLLVSNVQPTIIVDPVKTDLVISTDNASLSTVTVSSTVTTAELNYSKILQRGSTDTVHIDNPLTITKDSNGDSQPDVQVVIPAGITMDGPTTWRGVVTLPTVVSNPPLPQEPNTIITPSKSIEIGFGSTTLTFDKAVRMSFIGDAGKRVGYFNSVTPFTEITTICSADTQAANDGLPAGGNCKINVGSNLVIWTKHFTGFASFGSSSSGSGGGGSGGGAVGVGPSGGGGGVAAGFGGTAVPYLKILQVSYDVCDTKMVKIVVSTDNRKDPTVIIRSSISGVSDAQLATEQPYAAQNTNATIRKLVYDARIDPHEKSFEVLALEAIGHDIYSEGKTVEVSSCQETINILNEFPTQATQIDLTAPKIFDVKFKIGNGTKVLSSDVTDQYVDNKPISVYSIIDSPKPLDRAELRYVTLGQNMNNYATAKMDIVPLAVSNSTYVISGTIPPQFMKSPAVQYWIHVENQAGKASDSIQYGVGVKPDYHTNGQLEFDIIHYRVEGSTATPTAYFTNNSTGPFFGTVSLVVDGNIVYTLPPQIFDVGQTKVQLNWKTIALGHLTTYQVQTRAAFYGKSFESEIKIINTFPSTQTVPLSQSKIIGPIVSQDGHTIAIPIIIHSSFNNEGRMRYNVTSPDGICVIGPYDNCLVTKSTFGLPSEVKSVTLGNQIYRIRYSGPDSPLERFEITSVDPIVGKWKVGIDSKDGLVPQAYAMEHNFLQIKYKPISTLKT
jgi:hypothetical protein